MMRAEAEISSASAGEMFVFFFPPQFATVIKYEHILANFFLFDDFGLFISTCAC